MDVTQTAEGKGGERDLKKIEKYFSKHIYFNSLMHLVGGMGIGILITHPYIDPNPVRWGALLLAVAILGHAYAYFVKN